MALRRGHEQAIHDWQRPAGQFGLGGKLGPGAEGGRIQRQDAAGKALFHFAQPRSEFLGAARVAGSEFENPLFDFAQADDADEQAGFVLFVEPADDLGVRGLLDVFG